MRLHWPNFAERFRRYHLLKFVTLLITVCTVAVMAQQTITEPFRHAMEGDKLVRANTNFSLNLYRELLKAKAGQNIFYSPASISIAMAMTYLGAKGNTAEEMKAALNFAEVHEASLHECFSDLHDALHQSADRIVLHTANRLFGDKSFEIVQEFLDRSLQFYKADLASVDFRSNTEGARLEINQWVEDKTNQKIKDILAPGSIDATTALVLVNAIYFKGDWSKKFDAKDTKPMDFHVSDSEKFPVDMMYKKAKWSYGINRDMDTQCVELPYVNDTLSMFLLLPAAGKMSELEANLTVDHLSDILKTFRMHPVDVHVWLPKFKLEDSFSLADHLASLGIRDLFDESRADLSGIAVRNNVFVDKVLHKAFIEVNEEGSEAAAATAVVMMLRAMPMKLEFKADRPFLFFIRENASKSILFMGKVARPQATEAKDEL